jgi:hypothetical protein
MLVNNQELLVPIHDKDHGYPPQHQWLLMYLDRLV